MKAFALFTLILLIPAGPLNAQYSNHKQVVAEIKALGQDTTIARAASIAKTKGERDIWILTVGKGDYNNKPGIAVIGGINGASLASVEIVLQMAEKLVKSKSPVLEDNTFYFLPDVSPDASEQYFAPVRYERNRNAVPSDDDKDGRFDEDGFDDLNQDGLISWMRIPDADKGQYMIHPENPEVMVKADVSKGQKGSYLLLKEGFDNDKDGEINEDAQGGVVFNKNFSYNYPYFTDGAGENSLSEAETRAVAKFLFDEIQQQLVEHPFEEVQVGAAVDHEHPDGGQRMDGRIDVVEAPLIRGQRTVRMLEPLPEEHHQLVFGERRIQVRPGDGVKRQVPGREPRVLPRVGHGKHVERVQVPPPRVPAVAMPGRRRRLGGVAIQPPVDPIRVHLLAPDQPRAGLAHHPHGLIADVSRGDRGVELVRLPLPVCHDVVEVGAGPAGGACGLVADGPVQPQPQLGTPPARHAHLIPPGRLRPLLLRIHGLRAGDHVIVDAVLRIGGDRSRPEQPAQVRLVVAKQRLRPDALLGGSGIEPVSGQPWVLDGDPVPVQEQRRRLAARNPPRVAEPHRRQYRQHRVLGRMVFDGDAGQDLRRGSLRVRDIHGPVAAVVENAGIQQLKLGFVPGPTRVLVDQLLVRKRRLRVVIPPAQPCVAGQRVRVPPVFLDVLPVIALRAGQPEHPLLQNRIGPVPQRQSQTQVMVDVGQPRHAVLVPPECTGPGMIMRKIPPRVTAVAVVLPNRAPSALR